MRSKLSACAVIFVWAICLCARAQSVLEPDNFNAVVYLDTASGKVVPLERETASESTKLRALGFGGAKQVASVPGSSSPVRFPAGQSHTFAVRLAQGADPGKFHLYKFASTGNAREVVLTNAYVVGAKAGMGTVHFDTSTLGTTSFKFVTESNLPPGEYGFSANDSQDVYCFSLK